MAGILNFLGLGDSPQGGILAGGGMPSAAPTWQSRIGLIGAGLADAGATLGGHPADANNLDSYQKLVQRQKLQQAYQLGANPNTDAASRQAAYSQIAAMGGDPSSLMKLQSQAALPQLMQNLQLSQGFNDNPVGVTPAVNAQGPGVDAARTAAQQTNAGPAMSMQPATLQGALQRTGSPELTAEMAPKLLDQQAQIAAKSVRQATPEEKVAGGYKVTDPVFIDAYKNLSSEVKPQAAIDQTQKAAATAPLTPYQRAQLGASAAERNEKIREFNLTNPMAASGGGSSLSPDITSYSPQVQSTVKAMLEGRQPPPTSFALSKPYWQNLMAIANAVDPTFDQTKWGARASFRKDVEGGGKSSQTLNAGNTAIQHLGRLNDQIGDVSGVQFPLVGNLVNRGINAGNQASGVPGVNAYNDTLGHLAEETTKFYRGSGGAEADVSRNMGNLAPDLSAAQKRAGVQNTVDLIYGKLAPMVEQYNKATGYNYPVSHFLSKQAVGTLKRMGYDPDTGEKLSAPAQATPTAPVSPANLPRLGAGKVLQYDAQGNRQ